MWLGQMECRGSTPAAHLQLLQLQRAPGRRPLPAAAGRRRRRSRRQLLPNLLAGGLHRGRHLGAQLRGGFLSGGGWRVGGGGGWRLGLV
jgi:hypothetical protein